MTNDPADDPLYQAGYRQGLADRVEAPGPTARRRYLFAAGTFAFGIGSAAVTMMLFSKKHQELGQVLAFSVAVVGSSFAAARILADSRPETPTLRLKV
jgi:hypothetical protein